MITRTALTVAALVGSTAAFGPLAPAPSVRAEGLRYHETLPAAAPATPPAPAGTVRPRRTATTAKPSNGESWLYSYIDLLLGGRTAPPRRPKTAHHGKPAQPVHALTVSATQPAPMPAVVAPAAPAPSPVTSEQPAPASAPAPHTMAPPAPSPFVTGALPPAPVSPPAEAARVRMLDADLAAQDLVKLELARRVYGESRLPGERVFQLTPDWVVLERARDSMTDTERAAADAAGFDATAYINDKDHLVVVAIAGTQDVVRDFIANDVWRALIQARAPQQFYFATQYIRGVNKRYVGAGYRIECVGHSLGGGACVYAAAELGIEARVVNPISAGRIDASAANLVVNYVVDGEIASLVYGARGNQTAGSVKVIEPAQAGTIHARLAERWGRLAGVAFIVENLPNAVADHRIDAALDLIARQAGVSRIH